MQIPDNFLRLSLSKTFSYFAIFLVAIAPFFSYIFYKVTHKYITTFELFLTILILVLIIFEKWQIKLPRYLILYLLFAIYTIFSDKYLADRTINLKYFRENVIVIGFFYLLIIENTNFSKEFVKQILQISYYVIIIAFIVILIQEIFNKNFFVNEQITEFQSNQMRDYANYKLASIYTYYVYLMRVSLCFSPILAILIGDELYKSTRQNEKNDRKIYFLYIIGIIFSFLSRTRILLVFYALTIVLYLIYKGFTLKTYIRTGLILIAAFIVLWFVAPKFGIATDKIINERILGEAKRGGIVKGSTRYLAFEVFKQVFTENKIFGKGRLSLSTINYDAQGKKDIRLIRTLHGRSSQIHVGYLALFYWYGYCGAILFLCFLLMTTIYLFRNLKRHGYWGAFIGWIMYIIFHLTDVSFDVRYMGIILIFFINKNVSDHKNFTE